MSIHDLRVWIESRMPWWAVLVPCMLIVAWMAVWPWRGHILEWIDRKVWHFAKDDE